MKGANTMPEVITTQEVSTDELTLQPNKAESAIAFLDYWSQWLATIVEIIKNFFDRIKEAFDSAE